MTNSLIDQGYEEVDFEDFEEALATGRQLIKLGQSAGFEIAALASAGLDDLDQAILILEQGVETDPSVWLLWHLLANYYSDAGRFDDAQVSYRKALDCPKADRSYIYYNWALVDLRRGHPEETLNRLSEVPADQMDELHHSLMAAAHLELGNIAAADRAVELFFKNINEETETGELASAFAMRAEIRQQQDSLDEAAQSAREALQLDAQQWRAKKLLRELRSLKSPNSREFRILIQGRWHEPLEEGEDIPGFYASYTIVAQSPEEALGFVRDFFPSEVHHSLDINDSEELQPAPDSLKGVYEASGLVFYLEDDDT